MIEFYLIYALNTLPLGFGFLYSFKRKRIYSALWAGLLLLHILPLFALENLMKKYDVSILLQGQGLMLLGNTLLLFLTYALDNCLRGPNASKFSVLFQQETRLPVRYFVLMALLALLALGIRFRDGFSVIYSNWTIDRLTAGYLEALSIYLGFIFIPSAWRAYRSRRYLWMILLSLLGLAFFLIAGSRAMLLTLVFAVYTTLLLSRMHFQHKVALLVLLSILGFMLHTGARLTRGMGLGGFMEAVASGELITYFTEQESIDLSGGEANIYEWYNYVLKADYSEYPYKSGVTLVRIATIFAPRVIFPNRPIDLTSHLDADLLLVGALDDYPNVEVLKAALRNGGGGSTHPILWGDAYMNFGMLGFIIYPFVMSFLIIGIEYFLQRLSPVAFLTLVPIVGIGQFDVARGTVVAGFSHIAYSMVFIFIILLVAKFPLGIRFRINRRFANVSSVVAS